MRSLLPRTKHSVQSFHSSSSRLNQSCPLPEWISQQDFSFDELQRIQFLEDKANEALLVLQADENVLLDLQQFHKSLLENQDAIENLNDECKYIIAKFVQRLDAALGQLQVEETRVETLLRLIAARKSHMYGMLDYRNMEANKYLAIKAQFSTDKMEEMTKDMHEMTKDMHIIAGKTERETPKGTQSTASQL
ncbi:MAG: hypothetical protein M1821_006784 [Bathelium mastoideum]|nr:MAG: hypothetical protein M1821_006784 [Bathelium mastoideum]